ncbi:MAG: hypothetical protein HYX74_00160 [Acidobacteria bacterium]|nr:hypothetical protein [Acidobacteriota bacterium]
MKLLQPLAASTNRKGDRFRTEVVSPADLRGAIIEGEITAAKAAGKVSGRSELTFSFDTLTVDSASLPIRADLLEVRNSQGSSQVDEEGHVIGKSSKAKDAVRTGIMAGVGVALGGIFGGKRGAAQGAAIGAAVGLTVTFSTRGEDIRLAPGSVMDLEVSTRSENATAE